MTIYCFPCQIMSNIKNKIADNYYFDGKLNQIVGFCHDHNSFKDISFFEHFIKIDEQSMKKLIILL